MIGVHPNTVRLYEELGLISRAKREENGYRSFTQLHVEQFQLARTALQVEVLQNTVKLTMNPPGSPEGRLRTISKSPWTR